MLRVLWEFKNRGPMSFTELQGRCGKISPSVLSQRLRELQEAGFLEAGKDGRYVASDLAEGLEQPLTLLNEWAKAWARAQRRAAPRGIFEPPGARRVESARGQSIQASGRGPRASP
jgi:DNA-binding HxlR family transcriptional regulator